MKTTFFASLIVLAFAALPASAQISTDRPGLGYNPATVDRGTLQVELGLPSAAATASGDVDVQSYSFPVALRFGVVPGLELRLGTSLYEAVRTETGGQSRADGEIGFDVLQAGAKLNLAAQTGFDVALLPSVYIPAEGGDVGFSGVAVAAWSLPYGFGLSTAAGFFAQGGDVNGDFVAVLGRSLADRVSGYVEAAAYPADGTTPAYAGAGLAFLVSPDLQLDAHFDRGLTDDADDWLFGAGLSFRLQ